MRKTGIVRDNRFLDHLPGAGHPESHKRLLAVYSMLDEPGLDGKFHDVPARYASRDELELVHDSEYVELVASTAGKDYTSLDMDTTTSAGSYEAALLAAGGLCEAISRVHNGEIDNAFALVRPPGHHAESDRGMGFCLFNNVAVGAKYAREYLGIEKIAIIDWDLHHGNGTQHSFEDDPSILYFSTHQYPYYPGTGSFTETGYGKGQGYTVNIPLPTGCGDDEYAGIFNKILMPVVNDFKPGLVLVSAGFDIYSEDPLGGMAVSPRGFAVLTRIIMNMADHCCNGKLVLTLEGGYDLTGLKNSVRAVLKELSDLSVTEYPDILPSGSNFKLDRVLDQARAVHGKYWKNL